MILYRHVRGYLELSSEFRSILCALISRIYLKFTALWPHEISEGLIRPHVVSNFSDPVLNSQFSSRFKILLLPVAQVLRVAVIYRFDCII